MRAIFHQKYKLLFLFLILAVCSFCGCREKIDYFSYVSELRNNIFLVETEDCALRIYSTQKESPYLADGIPQEVSARTEIYLLASTKNEPYSLFVTVDGKEYGGEMSYDNVKSEYYLFFTLDVSTLQTLPCRLEYGAEGIELTAKSVLSGEEIPPKTLLQSLCTENADLFSSMTDKYGFTGEIYFRLIYEESPYYYVGIIDRNGEIRAFLVNAKTGKTLARRNS